MKIYQLPLALTLCLYAVQSSAVYSQDEKEGPTVLAASPRTQSLSQGPSQGIGGGGEGAGFHQILAGQRLKRTYAGYFVIGLNGDLQRIGPAGPPRGRF